MAKREPRPTKSRRLCAGCYNDFYNGNNDLGVRECWSFKGARIKLRKVVPIHQRPPWTQDPRWLLSCYRPRGAVCVGPDQTR